MAARRFKIFALAKRLPAVLVLRHHAELTHALTWNLSVPWDFARFRCRPDRFILRGFGAGAENQEGGGEGDPEAFHGDVEMAGEFRRCRLRKISW